MTAVVLGALLVLGCVLVGLLVVMSVFVLAGNLIDFRSGRRRQRAIIAASVNNIRTRQRH